MEGLHRSGEFPASIFELAPDDSIRPVGKVSYDVTMYAFDDLIAFSGRLQGPFRVQCSACLDYFDYQADFEDWNSDLDLDEGQQSFDLKEIIREDFLLNLPSYARCEELVENQVCPKAEDIAAIEDAPDPPQESGTDIWSALDDLS